MYIKIVDKYEVATKMVEAQEFEYRVVEVSYDDNGGLDISTLGLETVNASEFFGGAMHNDSIDDRYIAVVIELSTKQEYRAIVAIGCSIYVMSNDGKTVDVIRR